MLVDVEAANAAPQGKQAPARILASTKFGKEGFMPVASCQHRVVRQPAI